MGKPRPPELPDLDELVYGLQRIAEGVAKKHVKSFADSALFKFKARIQNQDFESFTKHPLSEGWAVYKKTQGLDKRVMIATGEYVDAIGVFAMEDGKGWYIGFKEGQTVKDSNGDDKGITLDELADIHENGRPEAHIPARPHWAPFAETLKEEADKIADDIAVEVIRESASRLNVMQKQTL